MNDANNFISFKELNDDQTKGDYVVSLIAIRPTAEKDQLIDLIKRQNSKLSEAEEMFEGLLRYERPIEFHFTDLINARMFVLTSEMAGAICKFDE